jgi:hypothetical protein
MDTVSIQPEPPGASWTGLQKNAFRFFFIFLGLTSLFGYNLLFQTLGMRLNDAYKIYGIIGKPLAWIDRHSFHVGYDPSSHISFFADGHFGWLLLRIFSLLSLAATVVWSLADRRHSNYNKLHYWFRTYLAFYLFFPMTSYGLQKMLFIQMPYPNIMSILTPLGQKQGQDVVWDFIGISPGYSFFTGFCEFAGGILVLFRRTRILGSLFLATVLTNVVCLNLFYNIQVKLLCMQLLLTDLFLLAPYIPKLFLFFYAWQPVSVAEKKYSFSTPWKNCLIIALFLAPVWKTALVIKRNVEFSRSNSRTRSRQRLYDVASFIHGKDTLLPLASDTLRWKKFAFSDYQGQPYGVIFNMQDGQDWYSYELNDKTKTLTLTDSPDTTRKFHFSYSEPNTEKMLLTGIWKGKNVQMILRKVAIDSLPLLMEKTRWLQNY